MTIASILLDLWRPRNLKNSPGGIGISVHALLHPFSKNKLQACFVQITLLYIKESNLDS